MAFHNGTMEYRICNADGVANPDESCFKGNVLKDVNGLSKFAIPGFRFDYVKQRWPEKLLTEMYDNLGIGNVGPVIKSVRTNVYKTVLPVNLTCQHCIFQVIY